MTTQKELLEQANKEFGTGGSDNSFLRFDASGDYKMRILTAGYPLASYFFGKGIKPKIAYSDMKVKPKDADGNEIKPAVKFVCYVIDRRDGQVKLAELPYSVTKVIGDYQEEDEFAFDDFPMPYDIKVGFNKDAAPADKYKVVPSRNNSELTEAELKSFTEKMSKMTPEQYVEKRKDKQRQADAAEAVYEGEAVATPAYDYPEEEIGPDGIPF